MKTVLQVMAVSIVGFGLFGLALFWPAGTFNYWQAWTFIGTFAVLSVIYPIYMAAKNPEVLRRRMHAGPVAETRPVQKIITIGVYVTFTAMLVISALDHRFGWSSVPTVVVLIGEVLVGVGLGLTLFVVVENSYVACTITGGTEQQVVATGSFDRGGQPMK